MDELLILLVRAIGRWLGDANGRKTPPSIRRTPTGAPPALDAGRYLPKPMSAQNRIRAAMAPLPKPRPAARAQAGVRKSAPATRKPPARRPAPPPVMVAQPIVTATAPRPAAAASVGRPQTAATAAAQPSVRAATLKQWMTPDTLRKQYVLTEIFQPPLSMRDRH